MSNVLSRALQNRTNRPLGVNGPQQPAKPIQPLQRTAVPSPSPLSMIPPAPAMPENAPNHPSLTPSYALHSKGPPAPYLPESQMPNARMSGMETPFPSYQSTTGQPRIISPGLRPSQPQFMPPATLNTNQRYTGVTAPEQSPVPAPAGGIPMPANSNHVPPTPLEPTLAYNQRPLTAPLPVPAGYTGTNFGMNSTPSVVNPSMVAPSAAYGQPLPGATPGVSPPPALAQTTPTQDRLAAAESLLGRRKQAGIGGPVPQIDPASGRSFIPQYGNLDQSISGATFAEGNTLPSGTQVLRNPKTGGLMLIGKSAAKGVTPGFGGEPATMTADALTKAQREADIRKFGTNGLGGTFGEKLAAERKANGGLSKREAYDQAQKDARVLRAARQNDLGMDVPAVALAAGRQKMGIQAALNQAAGVSPRSNAVPAAETAIPATAAAATAAKPTTSLIDPNGDALNTAANIASNPVTAVTQAPSLIGGAIQSQLNSAYGVPASNMPPMPSGLTPRNQQLWNSLVASGVNPYTHPEYSQIFKQMLRPRVVPSLPTNIQPGF